MKIVAGLGSIDEYIPYVQAGVDELFCGYVPEKWALKYGINAPLNRREVMYYNVQIGSKSELEILALMIREYKVPVTIALNALFYLEEQYEEITELIQDCLELGFSSYIIADPALLYYMNQKMPELIKKLEIHISGEMAEVNSLMLQMMKNYGMRRIIFHRKNTLRDMQACIANEQQMKEGANLEYEAFTLNEMCHYTGAFCNSFHCDEMAHICHLPYELKDINPNMHDKYEKKEIHTKLIKTEDTDFGDAEGYLTGETGCGLCSLWDMRKIGITHLKLVSRGNYIDDTQKDICQLRKALTLLDQAASRQEFISKMKKALFLGKTCSGNCYYRNYSL